MGEVIENKEQEQNLNEIEKLATSYGWRANGQKSAADYVKFALEKLPESNKRLEAKDNELFKLKALLEENISHMSKQKEVAYAQALKDITAQRNEAIRAGNVDLVDELDKKHQEIKSNVAQQQSPNSNDVYNQPAVKEFEERNADWLRDTSMESLEMQDWMERHAERLGKLNLPVDEHMRRLDEDVRKKFSVYFDSVESLSNDRATNSVESGAESSTTASKGGQKNFTINDLSSVQKEMARYLKDTGVMDTKTYIAQLVEFGDLK